MYVFYNLLAFRGRYFIINVLTKECIQCIN